MIKIARSSLNQTTLESLAKKTSLIHSSLEPKRRAAQLWRNLGKDEKRELRQLLTSMASGLERCMYCEDGHGTEIDHFYPKAPFPEKAFVWTNLLLACSECNSNYKRSACPEDSSGTRTLLDPTVDDPRDHLLFSFSTGEYDPIDEKGRRSIEVFGLNRQVCSGGRLNVLTAVDALYRAYDVFVSNNQTAKAEAVLRALRQYPFQSVQQHVSSLPMKRTRTLLDEETVRLLEKYPELRLAV